MLVCFAFYPKRFYFKQYFLRKLYYVSTLLYLLYSVILSRFSFTHSPPFAAGGCLLFFAYKLIKFMSNGKFNLHISLQFLRSNHSIALVGKYLPSSRHCRILPAYDRQSVVAFALAAAELVPMVVVWATGKTPRHNDIQVEGTPLREQQGVWSRPPAAHLAIMAKKSKQTINSGNIVVEEAETSRIEGVGCWEWTMLRFEKFEGGSPPEYGIHWHTEELLYLCRKERKHREMLRT